MKIIPCILLILLSVLTAKGSDTGRIKISQLNAIEAIHLLIKETKLPISVETEVLDPTTQGITASQKREFLAKQVQDMEYSDTELIRQLEQAESLANRHPNSNVDWALPEHDATIEIGDPATMLDQFCDLYQNYRWKKTNGHFLVAPKESELEFTLNNINVEDISLGELLEKLSPEFEKRQISFVNFVSGPVQNWTETVQKWNSAI